MSDLVLKSPPLTKLNFKYSQDSVIRFVGKRDVAFFDCHCVPEQTLLDLINYCIAYSDEGFHVSYYTYKAGIPLYITPEKLASKPYWFNQADYTELFRSSAMTNYFSLPLSECLIKQIDIASKTMKIQKGHLMMLATLTEFSPNPWSGDRTKPFDNLIDCAINLEACDFEKPQTDFIKPSNGISWSEIANGLKNIAGDEACDSELLNNFIIKSKNAFQEYKTRLQDDMVFDDYQYTISAFRADGVLVNQDKLPPVFSLRNLDALFTQNLEYYKHVLYLEVHNPFDDEVFVYYPSLTNLFKSEKAKSIFFSIPASFFYWLTTICGSSLRSRNSTLRQAAHNFIATWKEQWAAVPNDRKDKVSEAFITLGSKVQPNSLSDDYEFVEGNGEQKGKLRRGRGRPPKNPNAPPKPKPVKLFDNNGNEIKRGRGRPPKDPNATPKSQKPKPPKLFDAEGKEIKRGRGRPPKKQAAISSKQSNATSTAKTKSKTGNKKVVNKDQTDVVTTDIQENNL